jgi:hypothetical protein
MHTLFRSAMKTALSLAVILMAAGCAGYRMGPSNGTAAGERTIVVHPFKNDTMEPRLGEPVTHAMRKALQQDGTFQLNSDGDADVVVTGVVTKFDRSPLSYQHNDLAAVQDYTVTMTAHIKAVQRSSGKVLVDRDVVGRTTFRVGNDLNSAERQAYSLLANDLARRATMLLTDGEW